MQDGNLFEKYALNKDIKVRNEIIEKYGSLVKYVFRCFLKNGNLYDSGFDDKDILGEGIIGLTQAVERFDPSYGVKFKTYAISRIKGSMIDFLGKNFLPRFYTGKHNKLAEAEEKLFKEYGYVDDHILSKRLGVTEEGLKKWRSQFSEDIRMFSLSEVALRSDGKDSANVGIISMNNIADENAENMQETMEDAELRFIISRKMKDLPVKKRLALSFRYWEHMKGKEIGEIFNYTESRISQIINEAESDLRKSIEDEYDYVAPFATGEETEKNLTLAYID